MGLVVTMVLQFQRLLSDSDHKLLRAANLQSMGDAVIMLPVGIYGRWSEYNPYSSPLTA